MNWKKVIKQLSVNHNHSVGVIEKLLQINNWKLEDVKLILQNKRK